MLLSDVVAYSDLFQLITELGNAQIEPRFFTLLETTTSTEHVFTSILAILVYVVEFLVSHCSRFLVNL